jgi:hypothetical protein
MGGPLPDEPTIDRLLTGRVPPDDAPPGYAEVARVVRDAASSPADVELTHEHEHVAAAARMRAAGPPPATPGGRGPRYARHRAKVTGLVVIGAVVGTAGLAAAEVLPDPAQGVVAEVLEHVGVALPTGDDQDPGGPADPLEDLSTVATPSPGVETDATVPGTEESATPDQPDGVSTGIATDASTPAQPEPTPVPTFAPTPTPTTAPSPTTEPTPTPEPSPTSTTEPSPTTEPTPTSDGGGGTGDGADGDSADAETTDEDARSSPLTPAEPPVPEPGEPRGTRALRDDARSAR